MKTQLKKSLSLFLAVLMVLSCWVWVAPTEAEAATIEDCSTVTPSDNYTVKLGFALNNDSEQSDSYVEYKIWYVPNNGTGTPTTGNNFITVKDYELSNGNTEGGAMHYETTTVGGFPYYIECATYRSNTGTSGQHTIVWNYIEIMNGNGTTSGDIFSDQFTISQRSANNWSVDKAWLVSGFTAPESADATHTQGGVELPAIVGFDKATCTDVSMTINAIGGADVSTPVTITYDNYFDQYGVKWYTQTPDSSHFHSKYSAGTPYISKTSSGDAITGEVADDIYYDSATGKVVAKANLQISSPNAKDGKFEGYLVQKIASTNVAGGSETFIVSAPVTITYPKFTVKVNGEGSITDLNYTLGLTDGNTTSEEWKVEGYYGTSIDTMPDGTGSAKDANGNDAYTFKGLWTKEQPTTGNASYNAYEADFATPISSDKFDEYKADGGTVNGDFITYNDVLYYNAGTEWSTTNKSLSASVTYYGWWLSKDISIKFYDIDGTYLGTKSAKFGQTQDDIGWPTPTESYVSGAYTYNNFNGTWVDINGDTVSQSAHTFTKDLILTPKYDTVSFDKTYTVNFISEADGSNLTGSAEYAYRTDLSSPSVIPADRTVPSGIRNDLQYSYTFEGWSTQKPSSGNYHILLEDGDFNEDGTAIAINSDWIVRSDVTYYPVYRRHLRTYAVNFWFKDSTGAEISRKVTLKYGETLTAPTEYVPYTYAQEGYGYEFKNWTYTDASGANATFGYANSIVFTKENITFGLGAVEDGVDVTPVGISAAYGDPVPTPYTVTFKYKNDKGEDQKYTAEVTHGSRITNDTVNALVPAEEYDDGEALVHFTDSWKVTEGAADKEEYATSELTSFSPTSHITFEAVYGNPEPFYTVTYIDGTNTFSERVLVGSNLPVWTTKATNDNETPDNPDDDFEEDVEYLPTMADTAQGYYTFQGWFDEPQADADYAVTNGNKYAANSTVSGNLTLYPQFKFNPFTYTIKFMDYEGKVQLAAGQYEYGQSIEMITAEANRAAQAREQDNTYTYSFIGWDKTVPTFCEGKNMEFIAQYKPVYRYYNVKWYNSVLDADGNWIADKSTKTEDDKVIEAALLATTKHTYESKLNSPSVKATCTVTPPAGQSYVFAGWYYNDAEGNSQPYVRGMIITGEMEFYATYKLTAKTYTVTTDIKGETEEYAVADGGKAEAIPTPNAGYVDADKHDEFAGWVTKDADGNETAFDIANATITDDITIYAKFTESEHAYDNEELITAPTYYAKGEKKTWCSCDAKLTEKTEEIDMLADTVKPTGTIYLGTQGSWSSTGTPAYVTDNDPVSLFANADTDIIITANDTGDTDALYNPSGIGKGISNIKAFVFPGETALTADNYGAATQIAVTVFEDTSETLNNTANYVIKLGEAIVADLTEGGDPQYNGDGSVKYKALENGETYIVYYYVTDKAGNRLDRLVRTAKFIYDNTAPVFTVEGDNNADKVAGTPTYCDTAIITGIEDGATLTVNGVAVANDAITWKTVDEVTTGTYEIAEAGNYLVAVADKAGNKTSKKFQLNDDHMYDVKEVHSTCTEDGYKTEICIVCGDEKAKVDYPSTGHDWVTTHVPATCTENGYTYKVCQACGVEEKIYEVDGELIDPAHDHIYDMVDGEIVYTVVTEATCKTKGKEIATCKACGETISREIAIDEDAHNWGATKTLKATCTEEGKTYHTCKLCYISEDISTIDATGHLETQWVETTAAKCGVAGVETLQCKKCKAYVDSDDEDTAIDTREIPATGRHILAVSEDPTKTYEATADKEGQITRYCTQCGQEWVEKVDKIEKYTVKFVDEDGTTEIKTITDVVKGTTIDKTAVTEPTKANSADGKYKYVFAGWKDASGNAVTLPIDVTADITLKATYAQSTIIYTHQFMVPNTWVSLLSDGAPSTIEFATMMGAIGDTRVPVAEPSFALSDPDEDAELKKLYTFKFLGWSTTGAKGDIVTDFTIVGDATFYAVFEAEAISYQVIYYSGTEYVWDTTVEGGESVTFGGTIPTKAYDSEYHYTFDKWYSDATLKTPYVDGKITALTRLYAGYTATAHSYDKTNGNVIQEQSCEGPELTEYACSCGATTIEKTKDALVHKYEDVRVSEDGLTTYYYCIHGCGAYTETKNSHTVTFKHNGLVVGIYTVATGSEVVFDKIEPSKNPDAQYEYIFDGWSDAENGAKNYEKNHKFIANEDITVFAHFEKKERTYRVTYVDVNNQALQTTTGLKYGAEIPEYTGSATPTKEKDASFHYTFKGWSKVAGVDKVTGDMVIAPVFDMVKHNYNIEEMTEATCTTIGGKVMKCTCGEVAAVTEPIPALGHTDDLNGDGVTAKHTIVPATIYAEGSDTYTCERCGVDVSKTIKKLPSQEITITVYDADGNLAKNGVAEVTITNKANAAEKYTTNTDENGEAKFLVAAGQEWTVGVTGDTLPDGGYGGTVGTDGKFTAGEKADESESSNCSCSCHKKTFWGMIFRLFHKIIKIFTGKIGCCSDPDPKYN